MTIDSVVVLVGSNNSNLDNIGKLLSNAKVPMRWAVGIQNAVLQVIDLIKERNAEPPPGVIPSDSVPVVDIVGHAVQGQFIFGGEEVLSSCSDSYTALEPLRTLIRPLDPNDKNERWGLRLIGCDLAANSAGHPYARDNGTVLQFALAWFLQIPVWASSDAIFANDFRNIENRVPFERLQEVSTVNAPKIPPRRSNKDFEAALRSIFRTVKEAPSLQRDFSPEPESSFADFYKFDFSQALDATELLAEIPAQSEIRMPKYARRTFQSAHLIFGGSMLLAVLQNGSKVAYFKA